MRLLDTANRLGDLHTDPSQEISPLENEGPTDKERQETLTVKG